MSLNVSFKGYTVDENGDRIDCKFQVYYVRQNVWNDVRDTSSQYYSCNAGDSDSLTQDGELKAGDVIFLCFWQGDGSGGDTPDSRDNIFDRFSFIKIVHDGSTADYDIDVQLKPKAPPTINWYLNSVRTINRTVTAYDNSYDYMSWTYDDNTMYHRKTYYGATLFPKVDELTTEYDWDDPNDSVDGYESNNTHSYSDIGDYSVKIHVTNAWGLDSTGTIDIRIKYNSPIAGVVFDPDGVTNKIHTTESDTITAAIQDEDSRISSIEHHWIVRDRDDGSTISDDTVDTNTTLDYEYTKTIQVLQKHFAKQIISWNDGYDDQTIEYERELIITNWLPLVNFNITYLNDKTVKFTPNCSDIDGDVVEYKWDLYALIPFTEDGYSLAKTVTNNDDSEVTINFEQSGHYKMLLTATDDYGGSATFAKEFDVTIGAGECATMDISSDMFFMFRNVKYY